MGKLGVWLVGSKTAKGVSKAGKVGAFGGVFRKGGALTFRKGTKFRPIKGVISMGDEVPVGAKLVGKGKNIDEVFDGVGAFKFKNGNYRIPKGHYVVKNGKILAIGGKSTKGLKWTEGMQLVSVSRKLPKAVKTARMAKIVSMAKSTGLTLPGVKTTLKVGMLVTVGYGFYRVIGTIGLVSDAAEDVINNFYGINCDEDDTECQSQGAKNMLATGILGVVVIGGVAYYMLKPKKEATSTK
jgi:hypothetical protein